MRRSPRQTKLNYTSEMSLSRNVTGRDTVQRRKNSCLRCGRDPPREGTILGSCSAN